jgi:adenylylsulfate kinase
MDEGFVVWLTGLPASGKTTIARCLEKKLRGRGLKVEVFDGDEVRKNLSPDLGFTPEERELHNRRVIYMAKLLARNGVAVIISLISPYRRVRDYARMEIPKFVEVWVKCSIETCRKRDPKGLYKKAVEGEVKDMTGVQHPYEEPINPEVIVDTERETPESGTMKIIEKLEILQFIS